ncbi:MAG: type II toxin-antitoxin system Phd/YefM family antitoxin [Deltaproteobacteria bacterium]|nr:type II toxin-antitoxin system Phd/YefM family antitoxin [Deltaproteobacteria bacterium]
MQAKKIVSLAQARASLSRLTREIATGGGPIAITQRSNLAALLVNAKRYEEDMAELALYRRQRHKSGLRSYAKLIEIVGDLDEASRRLTTEYEAALKRSGEVLRHALRD